MHCICKHLVALAPMAQLAMSLIAACTYNALHLCTCLCLRLYVCLQCKGLCSVIYACNYLCLQPREMCSVIYTYACACNLMQSEHNYMVIPWSVSTLGLLADGWEGDFRSSPCSSRHLANSEILQLGTFSTFQLFDALVDAASEQSAFA